MNIKYVIFILIVSFSCNNNRNREEELTSLLNSTDPGKLIEGYNKITDESDIIYLSLILKNPYDGRVSHNLRYKGMSVYQAKMNAMQRISKLRPPNKVTYLLDSTNVNFYLEWAAKR